MNPDHDKQDELQKMLAAKKNVAPPRRALKGFSESVIDRLQKPEPPREMSLRAQVEHLIESKPVLVCLSGLVVFGCLAAGLVASLRVNPPQAENAVAGQEDKSIVAPTARPTANPPLPIAPAALPAMDKPAVASEPFPYNGTRLQPVPASSPASATPAGDGKK